jgi:hypothetical protein
MQQLATPASLAHAAMAVPAHLIRRSKYPPYLRIFLMVSSIFGAASFVRMLWKAAVHWGLFSWMVSYLVVYVFGI